MEYKLCNLPESAVMHKNMTVTVPIEYLSKLQAELDALKDSKENFGSRFVPEYGKNYLFVDFSGYTALSTWNGSKVDTYNLSIGNVHRTNADAIKWRDRLRIHEDLRDFAGCWEPDWSNTDQEKWFISYNHSTKEWIASGALGIQDVNTVYFKSAQEVKDTIKALGKRLDIML